MELDKEIDELSKKYSKITENCKKYSTVPTASDQFGISFGRILVTLCKKEEDYIFAKLVSANCQKALIKIENDLQD